MVGAVICGGWGWDYNSWMECDSWMKPQMVSAQQEIHTPPLGLTAAGFVPHVGKHKRALHSGVLAGWGRKVDTSQTHSSWSHTAMQFHSDTSSLSHQDRMVSTHTQWGLEIHRGLVQDPYG
jgi:hypothetical protein